jgi:hypothetical protein
VREVRIAFLFLILMLAANHARGDIPLTVDVPEEAAATYKWQTTIVSTVQKQGSVTQYQAPVVDVSYYWTDNLMLDFVIPWIILSQEGEKTRSGLGNSQVGVKWQFWDNETRGLSLSTFPRAQFNTPGSSADERGIAEEGMTLLLPLQVAKAFDRFVLALEVGYTSIDHREDEWAYSLAGSYSINDKWELLPEIFGTTQRDFGGGNVSFSLGVRWAFTDRVALVASAGRDLYNSSEDKLELISLVGLQFSF